MNRVFPRILLMCYIMTASSPWAQCEDEIPASEADYQVYARKLMRLDLETLLRQIEAEQSPHVALNSAWAIVSKSLVSETNNERIFGPSLKQFVGVLQHNVPNCPEWLLSEVGKTGQIAGASIMFQPGPSRLTRIGQFASQDAVDYGTTPTAKLLASSVFKNRFSLNLEPNAKRKLLSFAISEDHELAVRHVYTRSNLGDYVVASDFAGVRWLQRIFHTSIGESGDRNESCRAEVLIDRDVVWFFAISNTELLVECFELDSGKPRCRLSTLLFNTRAE